MENLFGWSHLNPNGQLRDAEEVTGDQFLNVFKISWLTSTFYSTVLDNG